MKEVGHGISAKVNDVFIYNGVQYIVVSTTNGVVDGTEELFEHLAKSLWDVRRGESYAHIICKEMDKFNVIGEVKDSFEEEGR